MLSGSEDRREDLLRLGALYRAIAAAAGLPRDDGGPQGVLGAPVRRIERRIEEEAEDGLEFGPEVGGEAARLGESAGSPVEQGAQAIDVPAAGHREALVRHATGAMALPRGEGRLEQGLHLGRQRMVRMVEPHRATATQ